MLKTRLRVVLEDEEPVDEEVVDVDDALASEAATIAAAAETSIIPPDSDGTCFRFNLIMVRFFSGVSDQDSVAGTAFLTTAPPPPLTALPPLPFAPTTSPATLPVTAVVHTVLTCATADPLMAFRSPAKRRTMRFLHLANLCRSPLAAALLALPPLPPI